MVTNLVQVFLTIGTNRNIQWVTWVQLLLSKEQQKKAIQLLRTERGSNVTSQKKKVRKGKQEN